MDSATARRMTRLRVKRAMTLAGARNDGAAGYTPITVKTDRMGIDQLPAASTAYRS